ncbi:hypothetical protein JCM8097_003135 [Rhodosporidiobolus ruineniae]
MADRTSSNIERFTDSLPRDYLSCLPVEILTAIFELAYADEASTGALSRALLPFDRMSRFERVEVNGHEQLVRFAKLVEESAVGQYVKRLELERADRDCKLALTARQLKSLFAALPSLTHFSLGQDTQAILQLILLGPFARNTLRRMTHLSFHALSSRPNPFDPEPLCFLSSYSALRSLSIISNQKLDELMKIKPEQRQVEPLRRIEELSLMSEGVSGPIVLNLLHACPSLTHLHLDNTSDNPTFDPLLARLSAGLTSLELRSRAFFDDFRKPVDDLLLRFTLLEHLYLGEGTFSPSILNTVRSLPRLSSLGFGKGAIISSKELTSLVIGSRQMKQLKLLTLDVVSGKVGWRTLWDGKMRLHPDAHPRWHTGPGWEIPRFTRPGTEFHDQDLEAVFAAAETSGIRVEGSTVEAVKVMDEWYEELGLAGVAYATETGDFDELRRVHGDDWVDEMLLETGYYDYGEGH